MAGNEKVVKFVKAHTTTTTVGSNGNVLYWMKLLYEFWGFCVNGTNDLRAPGGFATISGSLAPAYLQMAPGFESGSAVLIASGSDGSTSYGNQVFSASSVNWTSGTMVGRHLVTWQSGSTSLDDSVYPIVRVISSSSILVDTNAGATPMSASRNQPRFTDRTNVNFRVVDFLGAHSLAGATAGNYMILQFNGPAINSGQAYSQARIRLKAGSTTIGQGFISLSASGSWDGANFNDIGPESGPDGSNGNGGFGSPTDWFSAAGSLAFSLWGDQGAIISHVGGSTAVATQGSWFHIEVPLRLYPASKDPNPICFCNVGREGVKTDAGSLTTTSRDEHWSGGWVVHNPFDNVIARRHSAMVRNMGGAGNSALYSANDGGTVNVTRYQQAFYNTRSKAFTVQEVVLSHRLTTTSFSMGRCQLRRTAMATGPYQTDTKLGASGEWIAVAAGALWPWDNSQLPQSLFPNGT